MAKTESSGTRTEKSIMKQVEEVETLFNKHADILSKIFAGKGLKQSLFIFLVVSLGIYFLALLATFIEFDGVSPKGFTTDSQGRDLFFDFTDEGWGTDLHFMPLYVFVHLAMLAIIGKSMSEAVVVIPRVIEIEAVELEKTVSKLRSNLSGLLFALPFILYDSYFTYLEVGDSQKVLLNPVVHWIVNLSWALEWWIFGAVITSLIKYLFFIRKITAKYSYEANILGIVVKGELDPLIKLGYRLTIALGIFLIANVAYTIYYGFWLSDFIGLIIILITLPILTVVPLQLIERDVAYEQRLIADSFLSTYVSDGIRFIRNPKDLDLESKIDILVGRRLLQTFTEHRRETLKVYLRMAATMAVSVGSLLYSYNEQIVDYLKNQDLSVFSEGIGVILRLIALLL